METNDADTQKISPSDAAGGSAFLWSVALVIQTVVSWIGWLMIAILVDQGMKELTDSENLRKNIGGLVLSLGAIWSVIVAIVCWSRK